MLPTAGDGLATLLDKEGVLLTHTLTHIPDRFRYPAFFLSPVPEKQLERMLGRRVGGGLLFWPEGFRGVIGGRGLSVMLSSFLIFFLEDSGDLQHTFDISQIEPRKTFDYLTKASYPPALVSHLNMESETTFPMAKAIAFGLPSTSLSIRGPSRLASKGKKSDTTHKVGSIDGLRGKKREEKKDSETSALQPRLETI
jgi:hypothetical protein